MEFERVKEGPNKGQFVRLEVNVGSPSVIVDRNPPMNRSRTGYGNKIPTRYRIRTIDQRWRRVYCICYSNAGTLYVRHGKVLTIVHID